MLTKAEVLELLRTEVVQLHEEGISNTKLKNYIPKLEALPELKGKDIDVLLKLIDGLPKKKGYKYDEPSELKFDITKRNKLMLDDAQLYNKMYGAWLGRSAGCLLGKPVEGWTREQIEDYLKFTNTFPLSDYFTYAENYVWQNKRKLQPWLCKGNIKKMYRDDDMDYPIIGLRILEHYKHEFTTENVLQEWLNRLPYWQVYTAERMAYRNATMGLHVPATAMYFNPYREWIGAQIRADIWGWVTPGNPEIAADYCFRDARLTHTKNGIYGEVYFGAMISMAFVENDIIKLIHDSLKYIPANCRFAEMVKDCVAWYNKKFSWDDAWKLLIKKHDYHRTHTINNAGIVLLGLLYGEKDFTKTICYAVQGGLDTDCNGATAGSVLGIILSADKLPSQWISPLNDTIESIVLGFNRCKISELTKRTIALALR